MATIPVSTLTAVSPLQPTDYIIASRDQANLIKATIAVLFDSPAMTNNPTVPTQAVGNSSTRVASTAFVATAIAALIAGGGITSDDVRDMSGISGSPDTVTAALQVLNATKLAKASNLSDLANAATARTNLGFTNPILDKASPGDIGTTTPGVVRVAAGTAAAAGLQVSTAGNGFFAPAANEIGIANASTQVGVIVGGRLLLGHTASLSSSSSVQPRIQLVSSANSVNLSSIGCFAYDNTNATIAPRFSINRSRGTPGVFTVVNDDDTLGRIDVAGDDGVVFRSAAYMICEADGTWGSGDAPGRWVWGVTADGGNAPTNAMWLTANRKLGIGFDTPTAVLHLKAGTTAAGTAPQKFESGSLNTTSEPGTQEFNGNHYASKTAAAVAVRFGIGGTLFDHFANAGNGTTVDTDLYSDSIPASTLDVNGAELLADYAGTTVGHATATRQIRIDFAGTLVLDSTAFTSAAAGSWIAQVRVKRDSSSSVRVAATFRFSGTADTPAKTLFTDIAGLTLTNAQILKIRGQAAGVGAATNDIIAKSSTVQYRAPASL